MTVIREIKRNVNTLAIMIKHSCPKQLLTFVTAIMFSFISTHSLAADATTPTAPGTTTGSSTATTTKKSAQQLGKQTEFDKLMRQKAVAERKKLEDRAKARAELNKQPSSDRPEYRYPKVLQKYDANSNGRMDSWEWDRYKADSDQARKEREAGKAKPGAE
jgi:hypothetical protein